MTATIEEVQEFWDQRPCNIRHSDAPIGTREYFDYVEARKYFVEPHIPYFAQFARWKDKRVLEIGCGIGTDTINFARAGAHVTAVDLSIKSLDICEQRIHQFGLSDRIKLHKANCEELSSVISPKPYDLIYSFGVIHHTPNPKRAIEELAKYADSGTLLKLMLYAKYSVKSLQMLIGRMTCEAQPGVPVAYTYTKRDIGELLAPHFGLVSACKEHIFPWSIPEYLRYEYRMTLPWRWLPNKVFHALERMFGWHWLIEGKLHI